MFRIRVHLDILDTIGLNANHFSKRKEKGRGEKKIRSIDIKKKVINNYNS